MSFSGVSEEEEGKFNRTFLRALYILTIGMCTRVEMRGYLICVKEYEHTLVKGILNISSWNIYISFG